MLAVTYVEDPGGGLGDAGTSGGPMQLHRGGALPRGRAPAWGGTRQGIDYAIGREASVARGLRGKNAIAAIVSRFERPADIPGEIAKASSLYGHVGSAAGAAPAGPSVGPTTGGGRTAFLASLLGAIQQGHGHLEPQALTSAVMALRSGQAAAATPAAASPPAAPRTAGGTAFPVAGPHTFTDTWGAPRADTGHHEGTDIFAPRGTPVVAIENGVITKMGPSAIGGNRVWVSGKWYYAHLDNFAAGIRPGVRVKAGQVLGYVGDTGDARGTPTHLHFGWSPNGSQGASWANPYPVLKHLSGRRRR